MLSAVETGREVGLHGDGKELRDASQDHQHAHRQVDEPAAWSGKLASNSIENGLDGLRKAVRLLPQLQRAPGKMLLTSCRRSPLYLDSFVTKERLGKVRFRLERKTAFLRWMRRDDYQVDEQII